VSDRVKVRAVTFRTFYMTIVTQVIAINNSIVFLSMTMTFLFGLWDLKLHMADMIHNLIIQRND